MKINEIFYSLQGEGTLAGLPTVFVRTTGCNLRCSYCDTTYAYQEGREMSPAVIAAHTGRWPCPRVCLTGGEPLLQEDVGEVLDLLMEAGREVSVETNGSLDVTPLTERAVIAVMDVKCPASGMHGQMRRENLPLLRPSDCLKFVIACREDYEYARGVLERHAPACPVVMQPVWEQGLPLAREMAAWILRDGLEVRLSLQLHKLLWGDRKGV